MNEQSDVCSRKVQRIVFTFWHESAFVYEQELVISQKKWDRNYPIQTSQTLHNKEKLNLQVYLLVVVLVEIFA